MLNMFENIICYILGGMFQLSVLCLGNGNSKFLFSFDLFILYGVRYNFVVRMDGIEGVEMFEFGDFVGIQFLVIFFLFEYFVFFMCVELVFMEEMEEFQRFFFNDGSVRKY